MGKRLEGKVALITGAASGIGAAHAQIFAAEGAKVILTDIRADAGAQFTKALQSEGADCHFLEHDVADEASWESVVAAGVAKFGGLTTLINNAGLNHMKGVEEETLEGWNRVVSIDQTGTWLGMKTAMPHLRASGNGAIVNISSILGIMGNVTCIAFHGAKGAVRVMSKAAALEYAAQGVRVNSIYPGMIETQQLDTLLPDEREMIRTSIPMQKIGDPTDIAYASLYLCSDEAKYVTGAELIVDGGLRPG